MSRILATALLVLLALPVLADEVYRHVAPDGSVHYTDQPPTRRARPLQFGPISGATPQRGHRFYSLEALQAAARFAVSVESPTPGQQFRGAQSPIVAAVTVMPGVVAGFGLLYLVDDVAAVPAPTDALSVVLPSLPPGAHRLSVALIDADGRERARSESVAFIVQGAGAP